MDRLATVPRWLLVLPLVGLAVVGTILLVAQWNSPQPAGDAPPAEMRPPRLPAETEVARELAEPGLLGLRQRAERLLPAADPLPQVSATGFTSEQDAGPRTLQRPAGLLLLPPQKSAKRSEHLERIAGQADRLTRHGFGLASRGAYFAGRAEFIKALRLVAQGLDAEHRTTVHSRSLAAALTAVKEAEDFIPQGVQLVTVHEDTEKTGRLRLQIENCQLRIENWQVEDVICNLQWSICNLQS